MLIIDLAAIGASEAASGTCKHREVTIGSVGACSAVQQLAKTCGISDLVQVLERVLIRMQKDETSEVTRHPPKGAGTDGSDTVESPMTVTVTLHSWLRVETVPHTGQEVVRREMVRVDDSHARPMAFSTVEVLYTVREKAAAGAPMGSGRLIESTGSDTPRKFVVNEGPSKGILPCIDFGIREMKKGEEDIFLAPRHWAYGSPELELNAQAPIDVSDAAGGDAAGGDGAVAAASAGGASVGQKRRLGGDVVAPPADVQSIGDVEVHVTLLDFDKGELAQDMSTESKPLARMMHFKSLGTKWYQAGEYVKASKRYEEATKFALSETALDRMKEENAESITSDERKAKLAQGNQALASCYLNLAMCHIKLGDPKAAVAACSEAVKKDQKNLKRALSARAGPAGNQRPRRRAQRPVRGGQARPAE